MNHLQMFRYVQENTDLFNYEVRSLMRSINNELDLNKMRSDLYLLIKFTELKMEDEKKYFDSTYSENLSNLLLTKQEDCL